MASIIPHELGYRAFVRNPDKKSGRESKLFRTQREAKAWAHQREAEIYEALKSTIAKIKLADALRRYMVEISSKKRGRHWEQLRISAMIRDQFKPDTMLEECTPTFMSELRDKRLGQVSDATVRREMEIWSNFFDICRREWGYIKENPMKDVKRPRQPDHRTIVINRKQIKLVLKQLGYKPLSPVRSVTVCVAMAFLIALRTGMRAGEICNLTWDNVHTDFVYLPTTKTKPRQVPMSKKAMRLIVRMKGFDSEKVFALKSETLDTLFRRARDKAGLEGFRFHDSRHTAATWMAKKVDVLTLCKIFGWTDPKMAMVYYNPTASDISKLL